MFFSRQGESKASATAPSVNSGVDAEARAELFLQQQGLSTRAKNYRTRNGEIDLIMLEGNVLVFVEVRLRNHRQFATAAESVTHHKQRKIVTAAQYYLQEKQLTDKVNCRFDVIAFSDKNPHPEWIKNAFSAY